MPYRKKELIRFQKISNVLFVVTFLSFMVFAGIVYIHVRPVQIEEYCMKRAKEKTGTEGNVLVDLNQEELNSDKKSVKGVNKISLYYREFLICSSQQKLFPLLNI